MSKEREAFAAWYGSNPEQDENGNYLGAFTQARWETWQACATHYQPLLDAKDAELNRMAAVIEEMQPIEAMITLREENTTLKALLEQAREGLDKHHQYAIKFHAYYVKKEKDNWRGEPSYKETKQTLAAINAATGERPLTPMQEQIKRHKESDGKDWPTWLRDSSGENAATNNKSEGE